MSLSSRFAIPNYDSYESPDMAPAAVIKWRAIGNYNSYGSPWMLQRAYQLTHSNHAIGNYDSYGSPYAVL